MLDTLTTERLDAIRANWEQCPPVAVMVAAFAGFKPPEKKDVGDLLAEFPSGVLR